MKITIDTAIPLSDFDKDLINRLLDGAPVAKPVITEPAVKPAPEKPVTKPKPAPKPAPEPEPEPTVVEEPEDDILDGEVVEEVDYEALRKEAVATATKAISTGNRAAVVAALKATGAAKVGEIKDAALAGFIQALNDAEA